MDLEVICHGPCKDLENPDYDGFDFKQSEIEEKCKTLPGKKIFRDHDEENNYEQDDKRSVGTVIDSFIDPETKSMKAKIRIDGKTLLGAQTILDIKEGKFKGVSLGTENSIQLFPVTQRFKNIKELSLTNNPLLPETLITHIEPDSELLNKCREKSEKFVQLLFDLQNLKNQLYISNPPKEQVKKPQIENIFDISDMPTDLQGSVPATPPPPSTPAAVSVPVEKNEMLNSSPDKKKNVEDKAVSEDFSQDPAFQEFLKFKEEKKLKEIEDQKKKAEQLKQLTPSAKEQIAHLIKEFGNIDPKFIEQLDWLIENKPEAALPLVTTYANANQDRKKKMEEVEILYNQVRKLTSDLHGEQEKNKKEETRKDFIRNLERQQSNTGSIPATRTDSKQSSTFAARFNINDFEIFESKIAPADHKTNLPRPTLPQGAGQDVERRFGHLESDHGKEFWKGFTTSNMPTFDLLPKTIVEGYDENCYETVFGKTK